MHRRRRRIGEHRPQPGTGRPCSTALGRNTSATAARATFTEDLTEALVATGATLAFDAIGGGKLAGRILSAMEVAANRTAKEYNRYGSTTHKQVYIYGRPRHRPH